MFLTTQTFAGYGNLYDPDLTEEEYLNDFKRIEFMSGHLDNLMAAIRYKLYKSLEIFPPI